MAASKKSRNKGISAKEQQKEKKSIIDFLYVKLLRDRSTNFIIVVIVFTFVVWMIIPMILVLSGGVYFEGRWSGQPIVNVFTSEEFFNFAGDPNTRLVTKTTEELGGPSDSIEIVDGIAYVAEREGGIEVLNVSNPSEIIEITTYYDNISSYEDIEIKDNYLFSAAGKSGLIIFNISNINDGLYPVSFLPGLANSTNFLTLSNDLVILETNRNGFSIIDVSNVFQPEIIANVSVAYELKNIVIKDNIAYAVGFSLGIIVFNITDPTDPQIIRTYSDFPGVGTLRVQDITVANDIAYVALGTKMALFNVSNPADISLISEMEDIKAHGVQVTDNFAYVIVKDAVQNRNGIRIVDISNKTNLIELGNYLTSLYLTQDILVNETQNLVFLAQGRGGTQIIDITDKNNLTLINSFVDTQTITVYILSGKDRGVVINTLVLGFCTTLASVILGTALAFILARYEFPGKKFVSLLALAPLIIPPFISGLGFNLLIGPSGLLNNLFLIPVFQVKVIFTGFLAICYVQTSHFYALVYLNAYSSFLNIDPSMEESAENLGAGSFRLFYSVTLPLALPGIGAGSILVLILSMEDVGTPIIFARLGDTAATKYLTYYVFYNYARAGTAVITPEVCILGTLLLIIALIGFFMIRKYVSLRKYAMVSKGRAGEYRMSKAGWKLLFIYPFLIVLFALSLLIHIGVFLMSILKTLGPTKASDIQFTFDNYRLIFDNKSIEGQLYNIPPYMLNTVVYSVVATMLIIILGSLAAYVISRKEFKGKNLMDALVTLPIALPGIVLAIGYYRAFDWSSIAARNPTWINRVMANLTANLRLDPFIGVAVTLLILSYTVRKFPFTVRSAFAGLQQTDVVLEEASFNLGASRIQTFSKVTLPLISLNVFAGSLVSFLYCLSEVSTTIFLIFQQEAGTLTWYMAWMPLRFQIFCALGVLLMLLQVFSLFVTNVILGSRAEAITGI
jgi:ABC-type Fe3+ transport system permease subunit